MGESIENKALDDTDKKETANKENCDEYSCLLKKLQDLNSIKEEVEKLPLNPRGKVYFDLEVDYLIQLLSELSTASYNFSYTAANINTINSGKNSKSKDALKLTYDINDISEEVFKALKCKINILLKTKK